MLKKIVVCSLSLIITLLPISNSYSKSLKGQRTKLFIDGVVVGEDGKTYNIVFVPGMLTALRHSRDGFSSTIQDFKNIFDVNLYTHEIPDSFLGGVQFITEINVWTKYKESMKEDLTDIKDAVVENFLKGSYDDWVRAKRNRDRILKTKSISWPLGYTANLVWPLFTNIFRLGIMMPTRVTWNLTSMIGETAFRTVGEIGKDFIGLNIMTFGPAFHILKNPLKIVWHSVVDGVVIPVFYTGVTPITWAISQFGNIPTKESFGIVEIYDPDDERFQGGKTFKVTTAAVIRVIEGTLYKEYLDYKESEIYSESSEYRLLENQELEIAKLDYDKRILEIKKKYSTNKEKYQEELNKLNARRIQLTVIKDMEEYLTKIESDTSISTVQIEEGIVAIFDRENLEKLIITSLKKLDIEEEYYEVIAKKAVKNIMDKLKKIEKRSNNRKKRELQNY